MKIFILLLSILFSSSVVFAAIDVDTFERLEGDALVQAVEQAIAAGETLEDIIEALTAIGLMPLVVKSILVEAGADPSAVARATPTATVADPVPDAAPVTPSALAPTPAGSGGGDSVAVMQAVIEDQQSQ